MNGDLVIQHGRVVDPANDLDQIADVVIRHGQIERVDSQVKMTTLNRYDATGCIVTPGLIDSHIHGYQYCTPLGIDVDRYCLHRGVTTAVDAGSAGGATFAGFQKFAAERFVTRLYAYVHIAAHGLAAAGCAGFGAGGECDSLNQLDPDLCLTCLKNNPDLAVGVKVRLTADVCNNGEYEHEAYRLALDVSKLTNLPLMTHHTFSSVPVTQTSDGSILSCPGSLRPGDVYTHCFHGYPSSLIEPDVTWKIYDEVKAAKQRGVVFDLGHGQGSFTWTVGELCAKEGFWPDTISTDLHSGNYDGPVYDLLTCMSKMLYLGMPLREIIKATTLTPAKVIRKDSTIGSLTRGRTADITVIKVKDLSIDLEDSQGQTRTINKLLVPVAVWKGGKKYEIKEFGHAFPNTDKAKGCVDTAWEALLIKDATKPKY